MSERICVKKRETLQKYEALPEKSKKKKKYKRRDAERLLYAFVSNIPSQEFLSNGLYLRVQLFLIHCRSLLLYFPPAFLVCRWYPEFFSSP